MGTAAPEAISSKTIIIIIIICLIISIFGLSVYMIESSVGYSIELIGKGAIPVGNNATMKYKISKGFFEDHVNNVVFEGWLLDQRGNKICDFAAVSIAGLNEQGTVMGPAVVPTWNLSQGSYVIKTRIIVMTTHDVYCKYLQIAVMLY